jgi:hypothetical protein
MQQRGDLTVEFVPKTTKRLDFNPFLADPSIIDEVKKRMDEELKRRGVNVRSSKIEPDMKNFGLRYQAEYDPPKRYGFAQAIVAAAKAVIKIVVQVIKAIVKLIVRAVKAIAKFLQKLIVKIQTLIKYFDQALQRWQILEGRQGGEIDPNNPEKDLNELERKAEEDNISSGGTSGSISGFSFNSPWFVLAVALVLIVLMRRQ